MRRRVSVTIAAGNSMAEPGTATDNTRRFERPGAIFSDRHPLEMILAWAEASTSKREAPLRPVME